MHVDHPRTAASRTNQGVPRCFLRLAPAQALILILVLLLVPMWALPGAATQVSAQGGAEIEYTNLDGVPYDDRLVFSRIQNIEKGDKPFPSFDGGPVVPCDPNKSGTCIPPNKVHDIVTLRVSNPGTAPLVITGTIQGPWVISTTNTTTLAQRTIAPGASTNIDVKFTAQSAGTNDGLHYGALSIFSNDPNEPVTRIELAGNWGNISEGDQEPFLFEILRLFGYTTAPDHMGQNLNRTGLLEAIGEEVISPYWQRADTSKPVSVVQLAAYHTQGFDETFSWFPKNGGSSTVLVHDGLWGQSILPKVRGQSGYIVDFTPSASTFGFRIANEWSDPARNPEQDDKDDLNACGPASDSNTACYAVERGHHVRFWPVRDRSGSLMHDTWIVTMDYTGINYDYQDNVYLVKNIKPEAPAPNPFTAGPLPGTSSLVLEFDKQYPGTLADKDGQTTGFARTQRNRNDKLTAADSYRAGLLDINTGAGTLTVNSTAGSNGTNENTLVNGLVLPFDARFTKFAITTRVLGPITYLNTGAQQAGLMFGANQDNFIKLVAIAKPGSAPVLEFYAEQNGLRSSVSQQVTLPAGAAQQSLDLTLYGDPTTGQVRAAYRSGSGAEVMLPTIITLSGSQRALFFDRAAGGGIITSNKGAGTTISPVFDRFAIESRETNPARTALYRIDTGTGSSRPTPAGWQRDGGLFSPSGAPDEPPQVADVPIANANGLDLLYRTYRGQVQATPRTITYKLPIATPQRVDLRLHFAELYWGLEGRPGAGQRVFDVAAEGVRVADDIDIVAASGAARTALVIPINGVQVSDGELTLEFTGERDFASVAGIEVLASPPSEQQLLRRIDTGADTTWAATPGWAKDTGLYLPQGMPDEPAPGQPNNFFPRAQILYTTWDMEQVYQTYRGQINATSKIVTYNIPIVSPQTVKVQLHFAELFHNDINKRRFDVSIEGNQVLNDFDIYQTSGGRRRAVITTFENVQVNDGSLTIVLNATSGTTNGGVNGLDNVSIAGIEVFGTVAGEPTSTATATTATTTAVPTDPTTTATTTAVPTDPTTTATTVPNNQPPVVQVETPEEVTPNVPVTLDASASRDPEGEGPLTFAWQQVSGPQVQLTGSGANVSFVAPTTTAQLVFEVTVTDSNGGVTRQTIQIEVLGTSGDPNRVMLPVVIRGAQ